MLRWPWSIRAIKLIKATLVLWLALAMYVQIEVGMADQADFGRSNAWCTRGPVGFDNINDPWCIRNPQQGRNRYYYYYLPYWESQPYGVGRMLSDLCFESKTSTALLWLPGVLVNRVLYAKHVLSMPIVSLLPRLLMFGGLFALFAWIEKSEDRHKLALYLLLGVPLTLLLSTTDNLAYLNSFYQETGSFIYLGLWIASLLYVKHRPESWTRESLSFAALILLVCAKPSNAYWAILGLPFLFFLRRRWQWTPRRVILLTAFYAALTGVLIESSMHFAIHDDYAQRHSFNRLFNGILMFSEDPPARLAELGFDDSDAYVGLTAFSPQSPEFFARYNDQITPRCFLRVARAEPAALLRMLKYSADNMQDLSSDDLGKYTNHDPRKLPDVVTTKLAQESRRWPPNSDRRLNLWSFVK